MLENKYSIEHSVKKYINFMEKHFVKTNIFKDKFFNSLMWFTLREFKVTFSLHKRYDFLAVI